MNTQQYKRHIAVAACLAASLLLAPATASAYSSVYFFGDSLSDRGNVALAVGADPGQVITGNSYIPDRPYASGQFSNGDVWVRSFAASLGFASAAQPSLAGGDDYAFGGARVATDGVGMPPSLSAQTSMYLGARPTAPGDALFVVAGGGNDARDALLAAAASSDPFAVIAAAASAYAQATGDIVDRLQATGAQHVIVWDVPNLGAAPAVAALGADASFLGTQLALAMDGALAARLSGETGVSLFDVYGLLDAVVAHPAAYGLVNVSDACGAIVGCDPATYLFWDGIHPTSAGHELLAQGMLAAAAIPEPASAALLLGGLVLVRLRLRHAAVG